MWFNKVITKVRNLVLRVPSKQKLAQLFNQSEWTVPNPVKRLGAGWWNVEDSKFSITPQDLQRALEDAKKIEEEKPLVAEAVKVIDPDYQQYERKAVEERPKFKCKSPNCPEIEMGNSGTYTDKTKIEYK